METTELSEPLTPLERTQLRMAEAIIEKHIGGFIETGNALGNIRDNRLYRDTHKTFEAYISAKWDLERRYAYRLIEASGVAENVAHGPQTQPNLSPNLPKPTSERQVRPLTALPPEKQTAAWQAAIEKAEELGKPVTAAIVEQVVEEMKAPEPETPEEPEENLSAAILQAINTEKIKPTKGQREALAAMPEEDQDAILEAVSAGRQSLGQALDDGPAEPGPEEVGQKVAKAIESWCREFDKLVATIPDDPWIKDYRSQIDSDINALKKDLRFTKSEKLCPACEGDGCKGCKRTGRVNTFHHKLLTGTKAT